MWTLTAATTEYTVALDPQSRWLELVAWGPHGISVGPSPLGFHGKVQYMTPGDVAAVEYAPDGVRPFLGAALVLAGHRAAASPPPAGVPSDGGLVASFVDEVSGLQVDQHYRVAPGSDVIERWAV